MVVAVLLGAGASFGSVDASPECPPLGKDLFAELLKQGGVAASIPDEIKEKFLENFERGMLAYYQYADGNIMRFQRELALFFTSFSPGPRSNYRRLLEIFRSTEVVFCSLNYDVLLEDTAVRMGFRPGYGLSVDSAWPRLLKPHGSCNFWPDIPPGSIRGSTFYGGRVADISANVVPLGRDAARHRCLTEDSLSPAIAQYAPGKSVRVCPEFVLRQQREWSALVADAVHIFVIGVAVTPHDDHIWGDLAKTSAPITYFGFEGDGRAFSDWRRNCRGNAEDCFQLGDFSHAVCCIDDWLRA